MIQLTFLHCQIWPSYAHLFYTDRGNLPAWFRIPIYPHWSYTYWRFHFNVNAIRQLSGSRGGTWVEVLLHCLYNRDNAAISTGVVLTGETVKSASCWPSQETHFAFTHLNAVAFNEDGERWCNLRVSSKEITFLMIISKERTFLTMGWDVGIKKVVCKIKNMLAFLHLNS